MSPKRKSASESLFEFVLSAYNDTELADTLRQNAFFNGNYFIWSFFLFDNTEIMPGPNDGEMCVYAVNPFAKEIFQLEDENQDPRTGVKITSEEVAYQIHLSIRTFLEVIKMFESSIMENGIDVQVTQKPSHLLFEIVKAVFEDNRILQVFGGKGVVNGDFFIWSYGLEPLHFYTINPIKGTIHLLDSQTQKPNSGRLVTDESEILNLLEEVVAFMADSVDSRQPANLGFNPARYRAKDSFSSC